MGLKLFGKSEATTLVLGAAMLALVGESASAEQVDAANQELDTAGIKGAQLVPGATLEALTEKADRVDAAESAKVAADKKVTELETANTKLTNELAAEKLRADKLAITPGADSTTPVRKDSEKSDIEEAAPDANQKIVDDLHAKMLGGL